ncbi:uncharacterized protein LOC127792584 [Diospyros lotus]|uniref:uncharacterized protein LOC127792584 n=1 Tax=Diospyros lotus TaxID=55363 RepID=UPI002259EEDC|nr:uncharacterized protein LOC127792584 [Diospyros lotus]XP_052179110.1 uncharacterized protein LOC127792584 [Diospyros lotus]XP_052179118.1 uncharacterized protein LOC127792584 [Diospyros lotus]
METRKQLSSPSSFAADLFGSNQSQSPSAKTGIFASIFPPPSTVRDHDSLCLDLKEYTQSHDSSGIVRETAEITAKKREGATVNSIANKERNSVFQQNVEPCPLSSSLYYGSQEDMYIHSSSTNNSGSNPIFTKDPVEDDPNGNNSQSASRGNWWQGSLYY